MLEVGAYACLMEQDYPGDTGRAVECIADRPTEVQPFLAVLGATHAALLALVLPL
jgi:hypothetical protein